MVNREMPELTRLAVCDRNEDDGHVHKIVRHQLEQDRLPSNHRLYQSGNCGFGYLRPLWFPLTQALDPLGEISAMFHLGQSYLGQFLLRPGSTKASST